MFLPALNFGVAMTHQTSQSKPWTDHGIQNWGPDLDISFFETHDSKIRSYLVYFMLYYRLLDIALLVGVFSY